MRSGRIFKWTGVAIIAVLAILLGPAGNAQLPNLGNLKAPNEKEKVKKAKLTIKDVEPKLESLAGTELDPFTKTKVEYCTNTGLSNYDDFFKKSAATYGALPVTQSLVKDAQKELKSFAKEHADSEETKAKLEALSAEKEWNEKDLAFVKAEIDKSKGKAEKADKDKFAKSQANMTTAYGTLGVSVKNAPDLIKQGNKLIESAKSDFTGDNLAKAPAILDGLKDSTAKLKTLSDDGPKTYACMAKLTEMLQELSK